MFLWFSRLLEWLLAPLSWTLVLVVAAAFLRRRHRIAWLLAALALAVLVLFSTEAVADTIQRAIERGAVSTYRPGVDYDAVIVLGGIIDDSATRASGEVDLRQSADRIVRGFELVRTGHARNILVSGGVVWPQPGDVAEAVRLAAKLAEWGIPPTGSRSKPRAGTRARTRSSRRSSPREEAGRRSSS